MSQHFRWATRCEQRAVHCFFNEYKLRTHTLQARCGTFTLLPSLFPVMTLEKFAYKQKNQPFILLTQRFSVILLGQSHACSTRCAGNVCEGAEGWCCIVQSARGFRARKPREHTYNIYIRRASALLCHWFVETWEISRFKQWWMPEVMLTGMLSMYAKVCAVDITSYFISPAHF